MSSCTGTQKKETLTNCVITPCMVMKTKGIPSCTGTPGQPPKMHASVHKLEEAKAHRRTIGAIKCIWTTKAAHCFPFFLGEKLALLRFWLGPSIFLKNWTILLSTYECHQKCSPIFNTSQPQPRSQVYTVANMVQYGAGNCKKVYSQF